MVVGDDDLDAGVRREATSSTLVEPVSTVMISVRPSAAARSTAASERPWPFGLASRHVRRHPGPADAAPGRGWPGRSARRHRSHRGRGRARLPRGPGRRGLERRRVRQQPRIVEGGPGIEGRRQVRRAAGPAAGQQPGGASDRPATVAASASAGETGAAGRMIQSKAGRSPCMGPACSTAVGGALPVSGRLARGPPLGPAVDRPRGASRRAAGWR